MPGKSGPKLRPGRVWGEGSGFHWSGKLPFAQGHREKVRWPLCDSVEGRALV